jgi:hypothetical protein
LTTNIQQVTRMRPFIRNPLALLVGAALAPVALAHHGFGTFVMNEDIEVTGTVTGLDWVNPHSWLYLDVVNAEGATVAMRCEMRSANTLRRSGWTPELFPVGKKVTITGSPDRDDPYSCYVSTVIFDDGSSLDRYGQVTAPAEIGQGERPVRLANGQPNISGDWAQEQRVMTDPRGQRGTLVPLSEAEQFADNPEAAGVIGGARGTDQAAARAEAARLAREGQVADAAAAEAEAIARARAAAAAAAAGGGGPGGGRGGAGFGGGAVALTEAGQAAQAAINTSDRFAMSCVFTSIATEWAGDSGEVVNRVIQRGDTISMLYGRLGVERTIHLNVTEHPANLEPSVTGHSIGRWDGDTLIVDTVGIKAGLFNARVPHSDQLHLVEQFSFDAATQQLRRSYTATDPLYWTAEQTGTSATNVSPVPYFSEACEDLTRDADAELGPRR